MESLTGYYILLLKNILSKRQKEDTKYSLREFAKNLDISPTALSQIMNQKKGLSEKVAIKICEKLGLDTSEKEVFLLSVLASHSRNSKVKLQSSLELAGLTKKKTPPRKKGPGPNQILNEDGAFLLETLEVQELIARTEVHAIYRYTADENEMHFRILYVLKEKLTGRRVRDFIQITFNEKSRQGATVYFIEKDNGRFKTYFNNMFNGLHKVTGLVIENQNTEIHFDEDFLPTIPHIHFLQLNSNKHIIGKMIYTKESFQVIGTLIDFEQVDQPPDPNYRSSMARLHDRVK